jgi:hypothetical protein
MSETQKAGNILRGLVVLIIDKHDGFLVFNLTDGFLKI